MILYNKKYHNTKFNVHIGLEDTFDYIVFWKCVSVVESALRYDFVTLITQFGQNPFVVSQTLGLPTQV